MSKARGDEAADRFESWASSQSLSYFREIANRNRTQLVRTSIMDAVGIDRPALRQNARIQRALENLEDRLRSEGVLVGKPVPAIATAAGPVAFPPRLPSAASAFVDAERLSALERELTAKNAELTELRPLRNENLKLRRVVHELQEELASAKARTEVLHETGRLPR